MEDSSDCSEPELADIDYSLIEGDIALLYDEIKDAMSEEDIASEDSEVDELKSADRPTSKSPVGHESGFKGINKTLPISCVSTGSDSESDEEKLSIALEDSSHSEANFSLSKSPPLFERIQLDPGIPKCFSLHVPVSRRHTSNNVTYMSRTPLFERKQLDPWIPKCFTVDVPVTTRPKSNNVPKRPPSPVFLREELDQDPDTTSPKSNNDPERSPSPIFVREELDQAPDTTSPKSNNDPERSPSPIYVIEELDQAPDTTSPKSNNDPERSPSPIYVIEELDQAPDTTSPKSNNDPERSPSPIYVIEELDQAPDTTSPKSNHDPERCPSPIYIIEEFDLPIVSTRPPTPVFIRKELDPAIPKCFSMYIRPRPTPVTSRPNSDNVTDTSENSNINCQSIVRPTSVTSRPDSNNIPKTSENSNISCQSNVRPQLQEEKSKMCPEEARKNSAQKEAKSFGQSSKTNGVTPHSRADCVDDVVKRPSVAAEATARSGVTPRSRADCVDEVVKRPSVAAEAAACSASAKPGRKKTPVPNSYEAEYEMHTLPRSMVDYILHKGINNKFIKGVSRASVWMKGSFESSESDSHDSEKPLHVLIQGPSKQSVYVAIQLIKFLKAKKEEIDGISILEKNDKKVVVRKIEEKIEKTTNNESYQELEKKRLTPNTQETMLKRQEELPESDFRESKKSGKIENVEVLTPKTQETTLMGQDKLPKSDTRGCKTSDKIKIVEGLTSKTQETMLKGKEKLPESDIRRTKASEKIKNDEENLEYNKSKTQKVKQTRLNKFEKTIEEIEKLREKNDLIETEEKILFKERLEEINESKVKKKKGKIKTKHTQKDFCNFLKDYLNDTDNNMEKVNVEQKIQDMKQDHAVEKLRHNEKENVKDNYNASINKEDSYEKKRKCDVSEENKRKKRKNDDVDNRNIEFKKGETVDTSVIVIEDNDNEFVVEEESKTLKPTPVCKIIELEEETTMEHQTDVNKRSVLNNTDNIKEHSEMTDETDNEIEVEPEIVDKVYLELDDAPAAFDLLSRVEGPDGVYLQYISDCSQTQLTLRGRGSGFLEGSTGRESLEPLHICIQRFHPRKDPRIISQAKRLATELISTIKREYEEFRLQWTAAAPWTQSDPACTPEELFPPHNQKQTDYSASRQYLFPECQQPQLSPAIRSNSLPIGFASPQLPTRERNRLEMSPPPMSCNPSSAPISTLSLPTSVSQAQLSTTVQPVNTEISPSTVFFTGTPLRSLISPSSDASGGVASSPNLVQNAPAHTTQDIPTAQPLNESNVSNMNMQNLPLNFLSEVGSLPSIYKSADTESKLLQKQSLKVVIPASQSLFISASSESQFFQQPPPSIVIPASQSPCSTISQSQFFHQPPPKAVIPASQSPLNSASSESQFFQQPPPIIATPASQSPCSTISQSQVFHQPPPKAVIPASQSSLNSASSESQFFQQPPPSIVIPASQSPCSTISQSQFFHQPPPKAVIPASQSPLSSASSESQLFQQPPPSIVIPANQSPCSTIPQSQFFHQPPPKAVIPASQSPLNSASSKSQFFLKLPPPPCPPPFLSITLESPFFHNPFTLPPPPCPPPCPPPFSSIASDSQFFRKPPPSILPNFPQTSTGTSNQKSTQILPQSNCFSKEPAMNSLFNTHIPPPNCSQPNFSSSVNSTLSHHSLSSTTVVQPQLPHMSPPCQSLLKSTTDHQQRTQVPPLQPSSMESTFLPPQPTHVPIPPQSTRSTSESLSSFYTQTESFIIQTQLALSSQTRRPLQSTNVSPESSREPQPPLGPLSSALPPQKVQTLPTAFTNGNCTSPTPLTISESPKHVPPPSERQLLPLGHESSSSVKSERKTSRWDMETTLKSVEEDLSPTTESQTTEQKLQLVQKISKPDNEWDKQPTQTTSTEKSNTNSSTLKVAQMVKTLDNLLCSLKESLSEGLLKTKITQIALLRTKESGIEESEHILRKKLKVTVEVLGKVFDSHQDSCLAQFTPDLNQLRKALDIRASSPGRNRRVQSSNEEPKPPRREGERQARSKSAEKNKKRVERDCKISINSQFKVHLQLLIRSLQALINLEKKQIRICMFTGELDVLKSISQLNDEIQIHERATLLRTLSNLEKYSSAFMLRSINLLKLMLEKYEIPLISPDGAANVDKRNGVNAETHPFKSSDEVSAKRASSKEMFSPNHCTPEEKLLVQDVDKPSNHQVLPDIVLTTFHKNVADVESATEKTQTLSDSQEQHLREATQLYLTQLSELLQKRGDKV